LSVKGKTAEEISLLLSISKKTVERRLDNIKHKLNCYKQSQLTKVAIELGILKW
jgi:DNA-binding NarL/FixJ family response regulator